MQRVQLRAAAPPEVVKTYIGQQARAEHASIVLTGDAAVYKPNGDPLCFFVKGAVSPEARDKAFPFFDAIRSYKSMNRGAYAGGRHTRLKEDGTVSNTQTANPVRSSVAGFLDRYPRTPFCRESAFSSQYPELWADARQEIVEVGEHFRRLLPKRHAAQMEAATKTHPAYVIPGTPYTTLTINNTVAGCYHLDAGDYQPGFGCMSVFRVGEYRGCLLVFPGFGVAADLGDRDLILFDPHEAHGNTPFDPASGEPDKDFRRVSVVHYFRQKMLDCLSPAEELERVKAMRSAIVQPTPDDDSEGGA